MPKIINTFASENPLAKAIQSLGSSLFGDTLTPAIKRQQLSDLQRAQVADEGFARVVGSVPQGGVPNINELAEWAALSGRKADDTALWNVLFAGTNKGPRDPLTTNAMAGAARYGDSAENLDLNRKNAFDMNAADNTTSAANNAADNTQKTYEFENKPIEALIGGQPGFVRQGEAAPKTRGVNPDLLSRFDDIQNQFGRALPVNSGYRDAATNAAAGGAKGSQHLQGNAIDVDVSGMPLPERVKLIQMASANGITGIGVYDNSLHFDLGGRRAWGPSYHSDSIPPWASGAIASHMSGASQAAPQQPMPQQPAAQQGGAPATAQQPMAQQRPTIAPILGKADLNPLQIFQQYLSAAEVALPGATPEQKRQWALQQISKSQSKGITISPDGTVQIGGEGGMDDLTTANQTLVQRDAMAFEMFGKTLDMASGILDKNPSSVGAIGNIRGGIQNAGIIAQGLAQAAGVTDISAGIAEAQQGAQQMGLDPTLFTLQYDPSMSQIESVYNILAFQGVRAIGGQSGNDMSNQDFKIIKTTLGNPDSWFTNAKDLKSKMTLVKAYVQMRKEQTDKLLGKPAAGAAPATPPLTSPAGPAGTTSGGTSWKVIQ